MDEEKKQKISGTELFPGILGERYDEYKDLPNATIIDEGKATEHIFLAEIVESKQDSITSKIQNTDIKEEYLDVIEKYVSSHGGTLINRIKRLSMQQLSQDETLNPFTVGLRDYSIAVYDQFKKNKDLDKLEIIADQIMYLPNNDSVLIEELIIVKGFEEENKAILKLLIPYSFKNDLEEAIELAKSTYAKRIDNSTAIKPMNTREEDVCPTFPQPIKK